LRQKNDLFNKFEDLRQMVAFFTSVGRLGLTGSLDGADCFLASPWLSELVGPARSQTGSRTERSAGRTCPASL